MWQNYPPNTKNLGSELIFRDIEMIFFPENFLNITKLSKHYRFHFETFPLGASGAKDSQTVEILVLSLFLKILR